MGDEHPREHEHGEDHDDEALVQGLLPGAGVDKYPAPAGGDHRQRVVEEVVDAAAGDEG